MIEESEPPPLQEIQPFDLKYQFEVEREQVMEDSYY